MAYEAEHRQIMAALPLRFDDAFVAGGAVTSVFTNAKINDVDVYFKSRRAFETGVYQAYEDGLWCVAASKRAVKEEESHQTEEARARAQEHIRGGRQRLA